VAATNRESGRTVAVIESLSPATGEILGTVPIHTEEQVASVVRRARKAAEEWGALSSKERRRQLTAWRRALARRCDEIAALVHRENGKPRVDALSEVMVSLLHLGHAAARAERALRPRRLPSGFMPNFRATISYHPLGVVGVIGPWNYPIFTPMGSIAYALAAGNAVVFKPSEFTPLSGQLLGEVAAEAFSVVDLLQVVTGDGRTGSALARAGVDKIAFTGSASTGRKVMEAAAQRLTPVVMELGGKDALIVGSDADLDAAAQAAVFGALTNAGQACASIERCYVVDSAYSAFVERVLAEVRKVKWGPDEDADIGPITRPAQVDTIREHLEDAVARGANVLIGGADQIRENYVPPTVLTEVTGEMRIMIEETFGPVLPIARVASEEHAVALANSTNFGLGAAVFAGGLARALSRRLRAGSVSINAVLATVAIPSLPFGGSGDSGFGRVHGDEGLREFTRIQSTAEQRFPLPVNLLSFKVPEKQIRLMIGQLFGGGAVDRAGEALRKLFG
jgi:acyl-CoA reductase-like NAD-dependent aldehyde dehydrogenase